MKTFLLAITIGLFSSTAVMAEDAAPVERLYRTCEGGDFANVRYEFYVKGSPFVENSLRVVVKRGSGESESIIETTGQTHMPTWVTEEISFTLAGSHYKIMTSNYESPANASVSVNDRLRPGLVCVIPEQ